MIMDATIAICHYHDMDIFEFQSTDAFDLARPDVQTAPIVLNSPHSGRIYPAEFLKQSRLAPFVLRRSEDAYVDELFAFAPDLGIPLLRAHFPRAFLDVNREPYELDPAMFSQPLPVQINHRSLRVAGGLGTIPRIVGEGQAIYDKLLPVSEIERRINGLYRPYHRELVDMLDETHRNFGQVLLIDCHSMPTQPFTVANTSHRRADIVLGDRFGTSCAPFIVEAAEEELRAAGLIVNRNKPYAGGFITEHYGHPANNCHALQIEINRDLYMNEQTLERRSHFEAVSKILAATVTRLAARLKGEKPNEEIAAE
eukprot:gene13947-14063_t